MSLLFPEVHGVSLSGRGAFTLKRFKIMEATWWQMCSYSRDRVWTKQMANAYFSVVGWIEKTLMYLSSGWHFGVHNFFWIFFSLPHTDRKHLNSERTSAVIPHRLHPSVFEEPKPCVTPKHQSLAQQDLQDERKAKKRDPLISAMHWGPVSFMASLHKRAGKISSSEWPVEEVG